MTDDTRPARKTRRPLSLSDKLLELRASKLAALTKLEQRRERALVQLATVDSEIEMARDELARVRLALGEARDNERVDVDAGPQIVPLPIVGMSEGLDELVRNNARLLAQEGDDVDDLPLEPARIAAVDLDERLRTVAVVPGTNGAPSTAAVVALDVDQGTAQVESQHDTVAHAHAAINGTPQ